MARDDKQKESLVGKEQEGVVHRRKAVPLVRVHHGGDPVISRELHDDESSVSSNSERSIDRREHISNFFFLVGSFLFVWQAIWDISEEEMVSEVEIDDEVSCNAFFPEITSYLVLSGAAALCYVIDAGVSISLLNSVAVCHLRGYRNNTLSDLGAAMTFGIAAICDFASSWTNNDGCQAVSRFLAFASNHIYLVNAVLVLCGKRTLQRTLSTTLSHVGDALFLIGSIVDVLLSYLDDSLLVNRGNLVSSILWLVDSVLYILADNCTERFDVDIGDDSMTSLALI